MESRTYENDGMFRQFAVFAGILGITFVFLAVFGLTPKHDSVASENGQTASVQAAKQPKTKTANPERIVIPKISVDSPIGNPAGRDVKTLDEALLHGVVRYPDSAKLGENSNMLLFGHSTTFKRVINPAYKAFNGLKDLSMGDEVYVDSATERHVYKVTSVSLLKDSDAKVEFTAGKRKLTLSTCNTFGKKEERFVVEADFIKTVPIPATDATAPAGV
jgi:LPXTG-site transpeptidase (sortase) family protein